MNDHFNKLTPAQTERLDILAEECAEVIQAISKIKRHGYESCHPKTNISNRSHLEKELGDIDVAKNMLLDADDVSHDNIDDYGYKKSLSIVQYLHHNKFLFNTGDNDE